MVEGHRFRNEVHRTSLRVISSELTPSHSSRSREDYYKSIFQVYAVYRASPSTIRDTHIRGFGQVKVLPRHYVLTLKLNSSPQAQINQNHTGLLPRTKLNDVIEKAREREREHKKSATVTVHSQRARAGPTTYSSLPTVRSVDIRKEDNLTNDERRRNKHISHE